MLLDPVWRSVASKLGSHSCHCFGMSWAIFMLDRKTYDGKSQLLYRFRASALCEYYRLPSYSKHYLSGQFLHKTTFLMLLGWKYSHAFIQSHVADKTSPYWRLLSLRAPSLPILFFQRLLSSAQPRLSSTAANMSLWWFFPLLLPPWRTRAILLPYSTPVINYLVQIIDSCRVTPCLKPKLSLVLSLIYQVIWGPMQTKTLLLKECSTLQD